MKLIFAIVNNDDSSMVSSNLTKEGYSVTKLATTGGFLREGNTTFIIGVDDSKVDTVMEIIAKYSKKTHPGRPFVGILWSRAVHGVPRRGHCRRRNALRSRRRTL